MELTPAWSLAFIGSASARKVGKCGEVDAEALSITRLEGSRWRGGPSMELLGCFCSYSKCRPNVKAARQVRNKRRKRRNEAVESAVDVI
jgi:hypothetical protein